MQGVKIHNNLFAPENLKHFEVNNFPSNGQENNFVNGVQNARNLLDNLERSLRKSSKYEMKLLQCQRNHPHSHNTSEWWESDPSEQKELKSNKTGKSFRSQVDLAESWSTVSIVCLQYQYTVSTNAEWRFRALLANSRSAPLHSDQLRTLNPRYEELSKRYEALLQAYDERCTALNAHDATLTRMRKRARLTYAQVIHAHKVLLNVGDKYLALKHKMNAQTKWYEEKISRLLETIGEVMTAAEHARLQFDEQLVLCMTTEKDADAALMLAQIRKCNLLFLENLKLKTQIEEIVPGSVNWHNVN